MTTKNTEKPAFPEEDFYEILKISQDVKKEEKILEAWRKANMTYRVDRENIPYKEYIKKKYPQNEKESDGDYDKRIEKEMRNFTAMLISVRKILLDPKQKRIYDKWLKNYGKVKERNKDGTIKSIYEGWCRFKKPHGKGTRTWKENGNIYNGEFLQGRMHGEGTFTYDNGDEYKGDFIKDLRHGNGSFNRKNNYKYKGEFFEDKMHGKGTFTYADRRVYVGDFVSDKFHGIGTMSYSDGKYVGEWRDDIRHGQGTYIWPSGDKYVGDFVNGDFNGAGTKTCVNGDILTGTWVNGQFQGQAGSYASTGRGTTTGSASVSSGGVTGISFNLEDILGFFSRRYILIIFAFLGFVLFLFLYRPPSYDKYNGDVAADSYGRLTINRVSGGRVQYNGTVHDNHPHGYGIYTSPDGNKYEGEWRDGKHYGKGIETWSDGSKYEGEWRDDKKCGQGTFTYDNGDEYKGEWRDGKYHGKGTLTREREDGVKYKYKGEWRDGNRHGKGIETDGVGGINSEGEFVDGNLVKGTRIMELFGLKYEGEFVDGNLVKGKQTCLGNALCGDYSVYEGEFVDGHIVKGIQYLPDGHKYEGEWRNSKKHGKGIETWPDGRKYEGEFRDGEPFKGTFTWQRGTTYVGEFRDGKPHGKGKLIQGENIYEGIWNHGCFEDGDIRIALLTTDCE